MTMQVFANDQDAHDIGNLVLSSLSAFGTLLDFEWT